MNISLTPVTENNSAKSGGKFTGLLAVIFAAVFGWMMLTSDIEPIADTNGPDDNTLASITDQDILAREMGALHPCGTKRSSMTIAGITISSAVEFYSKDFSGIYDVFHTTLLLDSDLVFTIYDLKVESGNFKMVVVINDEIVDVLEPAELIEYHRPNVNGDVALRIAGESASYSFKMDQIEYDWFEHD